MSAMRRSGVAGFTLITGLVLTYAYRWILDDAFIYLRYADNLIAGAGLVFNRGEFVEGYTSPLWMVLVVASRWTGLSFWPLMVGGGLLSLGLFWLTLCRVNRALTPINYSGPWLHMPAVFLCLNYAVLSQFASGMETGLVQVCAAAFVLLILVPSSRLAQVIVALAPLVRPELSLAWLVAVVWCAWRDRRALFILLGLGGLLGGAWLLFRVWYYAELLPNTFYLKDGAHWARGWRYLWDTVGAYHIHVWVLVGGFGLFVLVRKHGVKIRLLERSVALGVAAVITLYVVRVGGDFLHYRYLAFPVTVVFACLGGIAEPLVYQHFRGGWGRGFTCVLLVGLSTLVAFPHNLLPAHPLTLDRWSKSLSDGLSSYRANNIEDSMGHRSIAELSPEVWDHPARPVRRRYRRAVVDGWCATSYRLMNVYIVHRFGLTDAVLSRVKVKASAHAGHKKIKAYANDLLQARFSHAEPVRLGRFVRVLRGSRMVRLVDLIDEDSPDWLVENRDAIAHIEAQAHNQHDLWENIGLASRSVRFTSAPSRNGALLPLLDSAVSNNERAERQRSAGLLAVE
jgi:hypothetical protein